MALIQIPFCALSYWVGKVETMPSGKSYYTFRINIRIALIIFLLSRVARNILPTVISIGIAIRVWLLRRNNTETNLVKLILSTKH